jgi:hypothetical protein
MRMSRRILAFALIAVFAAVLVGGCSDTKEETIGYTIRDFYSAYNAEDWEACLGHVDDEYDAGAAIVELLKASKTATGEVTVNSIDNVNITGSTATVDVTATLRGKTETIEHHLVKKDGSWKISLEQ